VRPGQFYVWAFLLWVQAGVSFTDFLEHGFTCSRVLGLKLDSC
jgi:hypothetical protein